MLASGYISAGTLSDVYVNEVTVAADLAFVESTKWEAVKNSCDDQTRLYVSYTATNSTPILDILIRAKFETRRIDSIYYTWDKNTERCYIRQVILK